MINLLLAIHNHQPVGNFEHVFEKAFKQCYWPVVETLAEFPKVIIALHHSGPLLDWAKKHEPNYIPTLVKMIKSGQIEPLGGGYYEPILAVIPPNDAAGQLKMMQEFWKAEAGREPRGIWLTERIWEPSLTTLLADNGVDFTILDDEHFRAAGITDQFILNYHLTERHGKTVGIFASDQTLRYYIPFKTPEDVISHLLYLSEKFDGSAVVYGDDGEKFGMWPGTHEWVIQKGWLKKFFTLLSENSEKIKTVLPSEFIDTHKPSGTVYLPACSYHEMGEWAMPPHAIRQFEDIKQFLTNSGKWEGAKPFLRGGYWDNFLTKYPEANYMHKRMLWVSNKLRKNPPNPPLIKGGGGGFEDAKKALYRAQCNCPYWHGLFGGLYLNYLRHAVYQNLIEADNLVDDGNPKIEIADIDCDRHDEIILSNKNIFSVVKPDKGGSLVELSHRKTCLNLTDVLARREEAYHKKTPPPQQNAGAQGSAIPSIHDISRTCDATDKLVYDPCPRYSFSDRIWPDKNTDAARRLCHLPFEVCSKTQNAVSLKTTTPCGILVQKTFSIDTGAGLKVSYNIKPEKTPSEDFRFGTELNLSLLAGHDEGRYYLLPSGERHLMDFTGSFEGIDKLALVDKFFKFRLEIVPSKKMDLTLYPVQTVSQSESGFDLLYQGSCIVWSAVIKAGTKETELEFALNFV